MGPARAAQHARQNDELGARLNATCGPCAGARRKGARLCAEVLRKLQRLVVGVNLDGVGLPITNLDRHDQEHLAWRQVAAAIATVAAAQETRETFDTRHCNEIRAQAIPRAMRRPSNSDACLNGHCRNPQKSTNVNKTCPPAHAQHSSVVGVQHRVPAEGS